MREGNLFNIDLSPAEALGVIREVVGDAGPEHRYTPTTGQPATYFRGTSGDCIIGRVFERLGLTSEKFNMAYNGYKLDRLELNVTIHFDHPVVERMFLRAQELNDDRTLWIYILDVLAREFPEARQAEPLQAEYIKPTITISVDAGIVSVDEVEAISFELDQLVAEKILELAAA